MRRLSISSNQDGPGITRLSITPKTLVFGNAGSFIEDDKGIRYKGTCIGCGDSLCMEYTDAELSTPLFQAFPHNTSKRVCPTHAITCDSDSRYACINPDLCIACGLCVQRCPTAAIQFDFASRKCVVNRTPSITQSCTETEQREFIEGTKSCRQKCLFTKIPVGFSELYQESIYNASKRIADVSEIIVRNTLVNMGIPCKTNAAGNNHNRTEFFGQQGDMIIIGESNSSDTDTLSVTRRILDDVAVMVSRYSIDAKKIRPLSVINGFPNRRTDYYEVVHDIQSILGIQISTVTYHLLFVLNLFGIKLSITDFTAFFIDNTHQDLLPALRRIIPNIEAIDGNCGGINYRPIK